MSFDKLSKQLNAFEEFGVTSTQQMKLFVLVASKPNCCLHELSDTSKNDDPEYRKIIGLFRKLSKGDPSRNFDGLNILEYKTTGFNREVGLTNLGLKLKNKLDSL